VTVHRDWNDSYRDRRPAWDIGRPQPAFARLADRGLLSGTVLDCGCGTGEHALLAASHGADVTGVDISPLAIERARRKAAERDLKVRFEVADALQLDEIGFAAPFDTVIDSGVFHVFADDDRVRYVASLASVLRPGGTVHLMCFSDRQPGDIGPRRVSQDELRAAFADGWVIAEIAADTFEVNRDFGAMTAQAWRAVIRRSP